MMISARLCASEVHGEHIKKNGFSSKPQPHNGYPVKFPNTQTHHVVVADADLSVLDAYKKTLPPLGYDICVARSGRQLVEQCRVLRPDMVITDVLLPIIDGIAAADEICRERPVPVVLVSSASEPLWVARALTNENIVAYLPKPIESAALGAALAVATRRFQLMQTLRAEVEAAQQSLEQRKLVERAKGALMKFLGLDEDEAFRRLRTLACERNKKLHDVAREVLGAAEVFCVLSNKPTATAASGH